MDHKFNLVFLIDDDHKINYYHSLIIEKCGFTCKIQQFTDGKTALNLIAKANEVTEIPDLILLDLNMPGFSGWEFIEQFREFSPPSAKKIHIYLVSNFLTTEDRVKAEKESLIEGYYFKPISKNDFMVLANNYR